MEISSIVGLEKVEELPDLDDVEYVLDFFDFFCLLFFRAAEAALSKAVSINSGFLRDLALMLRLRW